MKQMNLRQTKNSQTFSSLAALPYNIPLAMSNERIDVIAFQSIAHSSIHDQIEQLNEEEKKTTTDHFKK